MARANWPPRISQRPAVALQSSLTRTGDSRLPSCVFAPSRRPECSQPAARQLNALLAAPPPAGQRAHTASSAAAACRCRPPAPPPTAWRRPRRPAPPMTSRSSGSGSCQTCSTQTERTAPASTVRCKQWLQHQGRPAPCTLHPALACSRHVGRGERSRRAETGCMQDRLAIASASGRPAPCITTAPARTPCRAAGTQRYYRYALQQLDRAVDAMRGAGCCFAVHLGDIVDCHNSLVSGWSRMEGRGGGTQLLHACAHPAAVDACFASQLGAARRPEPASRPCAWCPTHPCIPDGRLPGQRAEPQRKGAAPGAAAL